MKLQLSAISTTGDTQSRVGLDQEAVADYRDAYGAGAVLPAIVVYYDGAARWLADGFHRYFGAKAAGLTEIEVNELQGTLRDAKLHAYGANKTHGLRRTNADKRKAIQGMLTEFPDWSDNRIAGHVGVDHKTVGAQRAAILGNSQDEGSKVRTVERSGKTYEQNVAGIGKAPVPPAAPASASTTAAAPPAAPPRVAAAPAAPAADPNGLTAEEMAAEADDYDPDAEVIRLQVLLTEAQAELATVQHDSPAGEALKWRRLCEQANRLRDEAMAASARSQDREKFAMDQLRRCGKAVGEDDPRHIARAVEKLAARGKGEGA